MKTASPLFIIFKSEKMKKQKTKIELEENQVQMLFAVLVIFIAVFFVVSFGASQPKNFELNKLLRSPDVQKISQKNNEEIKVNFEPVKAEEIYGLFICACCNQPLDKEKICCDSAKERIDFIDSLDKTGISKNDAIIKMVQKYGMGSLSEEGKKLEEEIKIELAERAPENHSVISIESDSFDFGEVSVAKGIVSTVIKIKNTGKSDLVINNIDSSCMCTTASINFNGISGPVFGMSMHGNPEDWSVSIPSGQEAELNIYYDPTVHPDIAGQHLVRIISIYSNDPINFEKKVRVDIDQVE